MVKKRNKFIGHFSHLKNRYTSGFLFAFDKFLIQHCAMPYLIKTSFMQYTVCIFSYFVLNLGNVRYLIS